MLTGNITQERHAKINSVSFFLVPMRSVRVGQQRLRCQLFSFMSRARKIHTPSFAGVSQRYGESFGEETDHVLDRLGTRDDDLIRQTTESIARKGFVFVNNMIEEEHSR